MNYCIVDIETTGGSQKSGKITEIAAYLHDGNRVIDKFTTLINPEAIIPPFITNLTRISNEMVADAPKFEEVAEEFDRFSANSIFVAHNVNFDYGFIRESFRQLGKDFKRKKLCTVQLARKAFPDLPSYSLGKISNQLGIKLDGHHRAEEDVKATTQLFEKILSKNQQKGLFDVQFGIDHIAPIRSPYIDLDFIKSIPDETGVFRFYDHTDELIYSKRSAEVLSSICQKLTPNETKDSKDLIDRVYRIDYNITGSGLLAQLLEANDVLSSRPKFNHGRFSMKSHYALAVNREGGVLKVVLDRRKKTENPEMTFSSFYEGLDYLRAAGEKMGMRTKSIQKGKSQIHFLDFGDQDFSEGLYRDVFPSQSSLIIDEGMTASERTGIWIDEGAVRSAGQFEWETLNGSFDKEELNIPFDHHPELEMITRHFIAKDRIEKIIAI